MNPSYKEKLVSFYQSQKRMPSYSEMMKLFGFKSKNSVYRLVEKFIDAGLVTKDYLGRLIPDQIGQIKMLGLVEAGFPSSAEEDTSELMSLDEYLIDNKEKTYLLRVKGESMIDAGIHEGDMVIVERTERYKEGDIVIAEVDGGWTMKYLRKENGGFYLEPANKDFSPIYPTEGLRIAAVVRGVVRKY